MRAVGPAHADSCTVIGPPRLPSPSHDVLDSDLPDSRDASVTLQVLPLSESPRAQHSGSLRQRAAVRVARWQGGTQAHPRTGAEAGSGPSPHCVAVTAGHHHRAIRRRLSGWSLGIAVSPPCQVS